MGFMDKLKGKVSGEHVDKAVDAIDDKTGGKLGEHADTVADKAKDVLGAEDETKDENN